MITVFTVVYTGGDGRCSSKMNVLTRYYFRVPPTSNEAIQMECKSIYIYKFDEYFYASDRSSVPMYKQIYTIMSLHCFECNMFVCFCYYGYWCCCNQHHHCIQPTSSSSS